MALNPNIILQGQPVNVLGAVDAGTIAGSRAYDARRTQQMHNVLQAYGGGLVQGDQGAMNAIAAFDPGLVMDVRQAQHGMMDSDRRFGFMQSEATRVQGNADRAYDLDREEFEFRRQEAKRAVTEALRQQRQELRAEELAAEAAADETAAAQLANMNEATYNRLGPQIAEARGERFVPWEDRALLIGGLAGGAEAANEYLQRSQEMGAGPVQQYETFEGPDGQEYYFDPANPGAGAQPIGGQAMPQGEGQSSAEAKLARIMETVNPNTGQPFTRDEAIILTEFLEVARDPMTDNLALIDRRTGRVWNGTAANPTPDGQQDFAAISGGYGQIQSPDQAYGFAQRFVTESGVRPEWYNIPRGERERIMSLAQEFMSGQAEGDGGAQPGSSLGSQFQQDPTSAFGLTGAARGVANTVTDAVPGVSAMFPETMEASNDVRIWREGLLSQMATAYGGRPPVWILERLNELIPESGRIKVGPEQAQSQLRALARQFQSEATTLRMIADDQTRTVEERRNARAQAAANDAAAASTERLLGAFGGQDGPAPPKPADYDGPWPTDSQWRRMTPEERALFQ